VTEKLDAWLIKHYPPRAHWYEPQGRRFRVSTLLGGLAGPGLAYGLYQAATMLLHVSPQQWGQIGLGVGATFLRVLIALAIALGWTVPVGVAIGTNRRLATVLQPVVQITASVPATALFPLILLFVLRLPGGLNLAAVLLMLMGTQWYLLFNIIAGASAIPQDLKYTTTLLGLDGWRRWRTLILPALFPYLVTGAITASGGAWNASIVAEYQKFRGATLQTTGIGALIASATAAGDYPLLLAATLSLVLAVILVNRLFWRRLYTLAEEKYRME
jgi:NitT/TauT family transport system permease protein